MLVQVSYHGGVGCRTTDDSVAHVFTWVDIAHVLTWMEGVMPTPLYPHYIVCFISGPGHLRSVVSGLSVPCTEHHRAHFSLSPSPVTRAPAPSQPQSSSRLWREINITRTRPNPLELSTGLCDIPQYPEKHLLGRILAFRFLANQSNCR